MWTSIMVDLPIVHLRDPWHKSFLGKVSFTLSYGILCPPQQYIFGYVYKIKF